METDTLWIGFDHSAPSDLKLQLFECLPPLCFFPDKPGVLQFCKPLRRDLG
jgi:hypothetical protein